MDEFILKCKEEIVKYYNSKVCVTDNFTLSISNVYPVATYYTLGYMKGTFSTTVSDGMYYEMTYNKEKNELYLDAYKKWDNVTIKDAL